MNIFAALAMIDEMNKTEQGGLNLLHWEGAPDYMYGRLSVAVAALTLEGPIATITLPVETMASPDVQIVLDAMGTDVIATALLDSIGML